VDVTYITLLLTTLYSGVIVAPAGDPAPGGSKCFD
jgi:hypothetical protein